MGTMWHYEEQQFYIPKGQACSDCLAEHRADPEGWKLRRNNTENPISMKADRILQMSLSIFNTAIAENRGDINRDRIARAVHEAAVKLYDYAVEGDK